MKQRFKLPIAVYLLLIQDTKVLLMRRFNTGYEDGNYSLCAGHVDGNEPITHAIIREAHEELGIAIQAKDLSLVHIMHRGAQSDTSNGVEIIDFFFTTKKFTGTPAIQEPHKCDRIEWFDLNHLPANSVSYLKPAIEGYRHSQVFSEYGWTVNKKGHREN